MKLLFTQENRFEVIAMRTYLESHGVPTFLRNEFTSSVMGEVPFFETWPEIWVSDALYEPAKKLVDAVQHQMPDVGEWPCLACNEVSPGTFELCWRCGEVKTLSL